METDQQLEDLLRDTFAQARGEGRGQWSGVGAGAFARADRLRRRRVGMTVGVVAATVGVVGAAVGVGAGMLGRDAALSPAVTSAATTSATATRWSTLVPGKTPFAYRFPDDVVPDPLPAGARPLALLPVKSQASASSSTSAATVPVTVTMEDPDLGGVAGFCRWEELADRRQPVAGQSYQFQLSSAPGSLGAHLGLAGFTTGTGADAMADLRNGALPCVVPTQLKEVSWAPTGDENLLLTATETTGDTTQTVVMAVTRVGDVLLSGTARGRDAVEARKVATSLSSEAASRLVREAFPPAVGEPLGDSENARNDASAPGATPAEALSTPAAYEIGDVFPRASQLPTRMAYHSDALTGTGTPAASGAQICDSLAVAEEKGVDHDTSPAPVAGTQRDAWVGEGVGNDAGLTLSVTGWATGTGKARFHDLQVNAGMCVWMPAQKRLNWPGADPDETWLSMADEPVYSQFLASRRVGDLIISVVVTGMSPADGQAEAIRLNGIVAASVAASDLPAAKGR